jgi:protein-tyrosine-phosphatase
MEEKGFDLSNNTRNQVTPEMVDAADRVILMLGRILPEVFLAQSDKLEVWDITDPVHMTRETTAIIMDEVTARVRALVQELEQRHVNRFADSRVHPPADCQEGSGV